MNSLLLLSKEYQSWSTRFINPPAHASTAWNMASPHSLFRLDPQLQGCLYPISVPFHLVSLLQKPCFAIWTNTLKRPSSTKSYRAVPVSLDGLSVLSFLEGAYKFQFKLFFLMRNNIVAFCWDVCLKWWKVESEKSRYEQRFLPASCYTTGTVVSSPGLANVFGQGPESRDFRPCRL